MCCVNSTVERSRTTGFSLIEVIVALAILAGGILGVVGAFSFATQVGSTAVRQAQAAELAEGKLLEAIAMPAGQLAENQGREAIFTWHRRLAPRASDELVSATVTVTWLSGGEEQRLVLNQLFWPQTIEEADE